MRELHFIRTRTKKPKTTAAKATDDVTAAAAVTRRLPIGRGPQGGAAATANDAGTMELETTPVETTKTDDAVACNDEISPSSAQGNSRGRVGLSGAMFSGSH